VKAVQRFDPEKGSVFVSYAVPTIAGEIKRYLRDHGWMIRPPRHIQDLRTTIAKATPRLAQSLGRTPKAAELAAEVGAELGDVEEALTCHESLRPASIDAPSLGGEGLSLSETLAADDDELARFEAIDALAPACRRLSDREKHILYLRFFEERTQQQIGDVLGVTQMQVSRLLSGILKRLREDLSEDPQSFPAATAPADDASKSPARPRRAA
jgi:RNA polymerase sigma-B factor